MVKNEIITLIRNAKSAHKKWVENAISLIEGLPLDKAQVPVNCTECVFGQWYYGEGQGLKQIKVFKEIEQYHDSLHKTYREIFVLLFEDATQPSLLERLFGISSKVSEEKKQQASDKLHLLKRQSKAIMGKLDELEEAIAAMADEEVSALS